MQRILAAAVLAALVVGGWQFYQRYQFKGLENVRIEPRGGAAGKSSDATHSIGDYGGSLKDVPPTVQTRHRSR